MTKVEIEKRIAELNEELKVLRAMKKEITDAEKPIVVEYEDYIDGDYFTNYRHHTKRFETVEEAEKWMDKSKRTWGGYRRKYNIHE